MPGYVTPAQPLARRQDAARIARQPARPMEARADFEARLARKRSEAVEAAKALPRQPRNAGRLVVR